MIAFICRMGRVIRAVYAMVQTCCAGCGCGKRGAMEVLIAGAGAGGLAAAALRHILSRHGRQNALPRHGPTLAGIARVFRAKAIEHAGQRAADHIRHLRARQGDKRHRAAQFHRGDPDARRQRAIHHPFAKAA